MAGGQYSHPKGLFFGGKQETWSNATLSQIAKKYLADASRVAFVDIHSGLGPFGRGQNFCRAVPNSPSHDRISKWWGERAVLAALSNDATANLLGTTIMALPDMLEGVEVTAGTLEYGTFGSRRVLRALQAENWLHHSDDVDQANGLKIKAELKQVFYPESAEWRDLVWQQGKDVVDRALAGLVQTSQ